jgi:crotonobetainyl-CoA:carnitine CoA-transferase CaiB-like acyl-CoA transferase
VGDERPPWPAPARPASSAPRRPASSAPGRPASSAAGSPASSAAGGAAAPPEPARGALDGVRVLDLSRVLAGPYATMVLADLGADVIKVERPGTGDDTRGWGPPFRGDDAAYFLSVNRGRRSVALDLGRPDHREALDRLLAGADVVVENFLPRHLERLGLDPDTALARRPGLVWASIRGAGSGGPGADLPGYDAMVQARAGLMGITGPAGGPPTKVGVAVGDIVTGLHTAVAILAALRHRDRTGQGQRVEVPLLEATIALLANQAANYLIGGSVPEPMGNHHPNIAPYGSYACADGAVMIGAGNDAQFRRLCAALGRDDLAADERFAGNATRVGNAAELTQELEATLATRPAAYWQAELERQGVPVAPVNTVDRVFADEHVRAVGLVVEVDHPTGPLPLVRSPVTMSATPTAPGLPPPLLGQHTEAVLAGLGYDPDELARLLDPDPPPAPGR